eukprot:gnl/TRDRNA2_/TRDRNA2_171148_c0_seq1.p1 gnl/TRDRNA2_/TRDRNA2_171148_c0~~gnl/TRDRNA2_/TRDRNA2_171148_c0_seq1.p1  ORF type:complete len:284 (+),score=62.81 gnl/TRDRNA2_/TRDRNA2_171148_c0_seq1:85-936(+)
MSTTTVIVLLTLCAQAHGKDSADKLAERLFDLSPASTDLDDTTLQKSSANIALPGASPATMRTQNVHGLVRPQNLRTPTGPQFTRPLQRAPLVAKSTGSDEQGKATKKDFLGTEYGFEYGHVDMTYEEIPTSELVKMMNNGWTLLDVRPEEQIERAAVKGAVQVPLFVLANDKSPIGIYKEISAFGMGGWWMGGRPMKENSDFVKDVMAKIPKDAAVIVACQSGLRAKQAMKQLTLAGYTKLAWLIGGYSNIKPGEAPVEPEGANLRTAGSGNIAGMLGWRSS